MIKRLRYTATGELGADILYQEPSSEAKSRTPLR